ncbi:hypothetical protein [Nostoc sp.]|uniref:hypothetical protein n=1 Tax=Nostoc sp. TaxID=1180 RepID=UPI002FF8A45B
MVETDCIAKLHFVPESSVANLSVLITAIAFPTPFVKSLNPGKNLSSTFGYF